MDRLVRTSAKALVIKDGCMLAIKLHDSDGDFYIMPGGDRLQENYFLRQYNEKWQRKQEFQLRQKMHCL